MSTLSVHNLQGISTYSNKIEIPVGHKLSGAAGQFRFTKLSGTNSKPSNPEVGDLILNSTTATLEVWTGDRWAVCGGGNRGGSQVILQSLEEMLLRMGNKHLELFGLQYWQWSI